MKSNDSNVSKVQDFHLMMDGCLRETPKIYDLKTAAHRADFKIEELVEFIHASASHQAEFEEAVGTLHKAIDKAVNKMADAPFSDDTLVGQADALVDLLYFTYGSFVLMGVDPAPLFDIVHNANMGKLFPDGKAHFDPVTHKILKPDNWTRDFAPEPRLRAELARQLGSSGEV